jgi:peroxiredoxin
VSDRGTRSRELWALLIAAAIGVPLVFGFARAMADGEQRRRQAPLRAMLGDDGIFERLMRGEKTDVHYLGNSLRAPDFSLPDRHGKPWKLSDQRGKVVVMNFWTITCQPCLEEMPSLEQLAQLARKRDDLEVIAVTTDESWDAIASVMPPQSAIKVLFDPDKRIVRDKFGSKLFPETWIIDGRGVVRMRIDGKRDWAEPLALDAIDALM